MWTAIFALLQCVPILARIIEKLMPTWRERQLAQIQTDKKHERDKIDDWIDRSGPPPV